LPNNVTQIDAVCHSDFCTTPPDCLTVSTIPQINNGNCDLQFNDAASCYDGGDCCNSTCQNNTLYYNSIARQTCGSNGYTCIDPRSLEVQFPSLYPCASIQLPNQVGDGVCDSINNINSCWDGGDCCNQTCVGLCSYLDCKDPKWLPVPESNTFIQPGFGPLNAPLWAVIVGAVGGFVVLVIVLAVILYHAVFKSSSELV